MKNVLYCIGAFLGIPEFVEHIVPDDDVSVSNAKDQRAATSAGHSSVTANERKSCGQSQRSARQRRKARNERNKAC